MSRVPMGSDGGAWATDPAHRAATPASCPQGIGADLIATLEGWTRERRRRVRRRVAPPRRQGLGQRLLRRSVVPVKDLNGLTVLDHDEFIRPGTTVESLAGLKPSFADIGRDARLRRGGAGEVPLGRARSTTSTTPATPRASSTAPRSSRSAPSRSARPRPDPARPDRLGRRLRRRPDDHADRPRPGRPQGAGQGRPRGRRHRPVRDERGLRRRRDAVHARPRHHPRGHTSTAARSRWATRSAPPAR